MDIRTVFLIGHLDLNEEVEVALLELGRINILSARMAGYCSSFDR